MRRNLRYTFILIVILTVFMIGKTSAKGVVWDCLGISIVFQRSEVSEIDVGGQSKESQEYIQKIRMLKHGLEEINQDLSVLGYWLNEFYNFIVDTSKSCEEKELYGKRIELIHKRIVNLENEQVHLKQQYDSLCREYGMFCYKSGQPNLLSKI